MNMLTAILFLLSTLVGHGSNTFVQADSTSTTTVLTTELSTMGAADPTQARACQNHTLVGFLAEGPRIAALRQLRLRSAPDSLLAAKGGGKWSKEVVTRKAPGFDKVKRVDLQGGSHYNKATGQDVPTPHTHGPNIPGGVRPANPSEIPGGGN
jgi:hypothetical protein